MMNTKRFGIKQTWDLVLSSTLLPMQPNLGRVGGGGGRLLVFWRELAEWWVLSHEVAEMK